MRGEECLYRDTRRETGEEEGIDTCERGRVFVQGHKKGVCEMKTIRMEVQGG